MDETACECCGEYSGCDCQWDTIEDPWGNYIDYCYTHDDEPYR